MLCLIINQLASKRVKLESSQVMGVKQSTDVMEKGTWTMISVIGGLCIISVMFFQKPAGANNNGKASQAKSAPANKGK